MMIGWLSREKNEGGAEVSLGGWRGETVLQRKVGGRLRGTWG